MGSLATASSTDSGPSKEAQLMEFSNAFHFVVDTHVEDRFFNMVLARLYYDEMPARQAAIAKAHRDTFNWLLEEKGDSPQGTDYSAWDSFTDWLSNQEGNNVYWIAGKPGSGKSTLMKYLFDDQRTINQLGSWARERTLVRTGFFFWNSGTHIQMSQDGLLRSILHTALSGDKKSLMHVFQHRWQQYIAFAGGCQPFTWLELRQAFEKMISQPDDSKVYFLMIDGLDEFGGTHKDLVDVVLSSAKHDNVKLCVASRPWRLFLDSFEGRPCLYLEQLTRSDIQNYVADAFDGSPHYSRLKKLEPIASASLIEQITLKASGVFLWVYLVVRSLLDGLSNADRMSDLVARLEALPPDLEDLYSKLLHSLDPEYHRHACELLRLFMYRDQYLVSLIELWFADIEDPNFAMTLETKILSEDELAARLEAMHRRILSRCKCFLEVSDYDPRERLGSESKVSFIHRTAKDYLETPAMWDSVLHGSGRSRFNEEMRWMNAFLCLLKSVDGSSHDIRRVFEGSVEFVLRMEEKHEITPVAYLDAIWRAALQRYDSYTWYPLRHLSEESMDRQQLRMDSFLDFAVWISYVGYVRVKLASASRAEILHARRFTEVGTTDVFPDYWLESRFQHGCYELDVLLTKALRAKERGLRGRLWEKPLSISCWRAVGVKKK